MEPWSLILSAAEVRLVSASLNTAATLTGASQWSEITMERK